MLIIRSRTVNSLPAYPTGIFLKLQHKECNRQNHSANSMLCAWNTIAYPLQMVSFINHILINSSVSADVKVSIE